jgi:hypothetical protein
MPKISLPNVAETHPEHLTDCESALEPFLCVLAEEAEAAGWSAEVVAQAMVRLTEIRRSQIAARQRKSMH